MFTCHNSVLLFPTWNKKIATFYVTILNCVNFSELWEFFLRILTVASYKIVIASLHLLNLTLFLRNLNLQLAILTFFLRILHLHLTILFCLFSSWNKKNCVWQFRLFSKNCESTKSLSRKVRSRGRHICNASGQLKQDQVLSKWMGESWNLKKIAELAIKLHISNQQQNLKLTAPLMLFLMLK